eukprot:TRINITY_DN11969_c0_g1_i1.p1 TRINITY_DN11969_c0_g1~~TRINITY_DN11969_c0_g1_i1.p1  ORF type:complete len:718 (+),score=125.04 TRINITY_DN11969_c0_g1_i1:98-2251(+)
MLTSPSITLSLHRSFVILLTVLPLASSSLVAKNCNDLSAGARLFESTLDRCLQRCRDDALQSCQNIAYGGTGGSQCALGVLPAGCGTGWTVHNVSKAMSQSCGFGKGKPNSGGACAACAIGSASHADVGDLVGTWSLKDAGTSANLGKVTIRRGGLAVFSNGDTGQFVLWHPRSDTNYPGAFFIGRVASSSGGVGSNWDYAWLEDASGSSTGPRLVLRSFCGAGPVKCGTTGSSTSPEGSPNFQTSAIGERLSGSEAPCETLEGQGVSIPGVSIGPCCESAKIAVSASKSQTGGRSFTAAFEVSGVASWDDVKVVNSTWNKEPFDNLQGATLIYDSTDPELCGGGTFKGSSIAGAVVLVAKRGTCQFVEKALKAGVAGVQGVLIVNNDAAIPEYLEPPAGSTLVPAVPAWMLEKKVGTDLITALSGTKGKLNRIGDPLLSQVGKFQDLCCGQKCKSRASSATSLNVNSICSLVVCNGYSAPVPSPPQLALPRNRSDDSCDQCPPGLAAPQQGLASCGACSDGHAPSANSAACQPCPAGSAGMGGVCKVCNKSKYEEPDAFRRTCMQAAPPPTSPTTTPKATVNPGPPPPPATTQRPFEVTAAPGWGLGQGGGSSAAAAGSGETASSFPVGPVVGVILACILIPASLYGMRWWYTRLAENGELDGAGGFGDMMRRIGAVRENEPQPGGSGGGGGDAEAGGGGGGGEGAGAGAGAANQT